MIATLDRTIERLDRINDPETIARRHQAAFQAGMDEFRKAQTK
jgi:hypothetical protein